MKGDLFRLSLDVMIMAGLVAVLAILVGFRVLTATVGLIVVGRVLGRRLLHRKLAR